ncbi:hypothetical protein GCM10027343_32500 [Noviherbaspirillum agri]
MRQSRLFVFFGGYAMNLARMMTDKFFVEDRHGVRSGPFKTKFGSGTLMVFQDDLPISEGDHIIRPMADGTERAYRVEGCSQNAGSRNVPAHYAIRVAELVAAQGPHAHGATDDRSALRPDINSSATNALASFPELTASEQCLPLSLQLLAQAIDDSSFPAEQKDEAKALLRSLLAHPVVASVLAGTVGKP